MAPKVPEVIQVSFYYRDLPRVSLTFAAVQRRIFRV
jgi:hypothetical protein